MQVVGEGGGNILFLGGGVGDDPIEEFGGG